MSKDNKILVYAYPGMYSYWFEALLKWQNVECDFNYTKKVPQDYGDLSNVYDVIFFNMPIRGGQERFIEDNLEDIMNQPFSDVYVVGSHVSFKSADFPVLNNLSEDESPLLQMYNLLVNHPVQANRMGISFTEIDKEIIMELNNWYLMEPKPLGEGLGYLSNFWKENLSKLPPIDSKDKLFKIVGNPLVKREALTVQEYVTRKLGEVRSYSDEGETVSFVYAENHHDSIDMKFFEGKSSLDASVLLIGSHTKGDDLIHVRTSKDTCSLSVAKKFRNNATGNKYRSMFFLKDTPGSIGRALSTFFFEEE